MHCQADAGVEDAAHTVKPARAATRNNLIMRLQHLDGRDDFALTLGRYLANGVHQIVFLVAPAVFLDLLFVG